MRKEIVTLILLLIFASTATITYALWTETLVMPQQATIPDPTVRMWLEQVEWFNETTCQWGDITPGQSYTKNFTVQNTGVTNITAYITVENLSLEWTLTWSQDNALINPNKSVVGDLVLMVPWNATSGTYEWNMIIHIKEV